MKILIEVPDNWIEVSKLEQLGFITREVRKVLEEKLMDFAVNEELKKMVIPEIKIKPEEIKDRMLTILAERTLEKD